MAKLLNRLGLWSAAHPWRVILGWIAVILVAGIGFLVGFRGLAGAFDIPGLASSQVVEELEGELPEFAGANGTIVFQREDGEALDETQRAAISALAADAASLPDVAMVVDPFAAEQSRAAQLQQLVDARAQLDAGQQQLDAGRGQLTAGQQQLDEARQQLETAIAAAPAGPVLDGLGAQLDALSAQLERLSAQQAQLDAQQGELDAARAQLADGERMVELADPIRVISQDGSTALVSIAFAESRLTLSDAAKSAVVAHFTEAPIEGVEVAVSTEISQGVPQIIGVGELVGLLIAAIVLGVMLRTLVGALIPLGIAVSAVAVSMLSTMAFSGLVPLAVVTPVLGVMLGLAVGIDYALFIINRHRKQLMAGTPLTESIGLATGTAGNAVVFAGTTVIVALLALNVTGIPFLGIMGNIGAVAILAAVLIAITMTPALLGLAGMRIISRKQRARLAESGPLATGGGAGLPATASSPTALRPMSWWRAIITIVASIAVLVVVALPALQMRVGLPGGESEPQGSLSERAYAITDAEFGAGTNGPLLVVATSREALDGAALVAHQLDVAEAISAVPDVVAVAPVATSDTGELTAFQVLPVEGPNAESTADLVRALRGLELADGTSLGVTGQAAINIDISERLLEVLPIYLAVVVGLSLLIMIVVFRSLLVPIIATGGFILSLFATYGATVAVFQWGWGADLLGLSATGPILNFLPIILIGILFGLAMDYQLFLSTGMREAYTHGTPARLAVTRGFRAGRSVVIAAGLIMVSIFGGFVFAESTMIRSLGFGLAVGILFDAFIVRVLLMPALMHVLGRAAWWLPRWLDRIVPNVDVEGASLERATGPRGA